ncbi:subtilisin-like protein [Lactarius psammicola]|nr:subtilisin-like protein [Lactarius psammicola]
MRYHRVSVLSVFVAFPFRGLTIPSPWGDMQMKHSWNAVPPKWETLGCPPAGTTIDLYIALKPQSEDALIDVLYEVSDPRNRKQVLSTIPSRNHVLIYGAHLSKEQVAELVAPHPDTLELVQSWLGHHNVPSSSVSVAHGGSSLMLAGVPISQANNLLGASYQLYRHAETNETVLRTVGYSLPTVLHVHVQTVAPTTCFASPRTRLRAPRNHSSGVAARLAKVESGEPVMVLPNREVNDETTPSFLRWQYNTWGYTPTSTKWNALGVVGFKGQYPSPWDLGAFMDKYRYGGYATFTVEQINGGGFDPSIPHPEANLDIQYAQAMAYPTPHTFYSTGRGPWDMDDSYLSFLNYILRQWSIPQTISISYGNEEKEYPRENAVYACRLFAQLGVRGVSVLVATGDWGVGDGDCGAKGGPGNIRFATSFPATCPYVTSVGGATGGGYLPEVAASLSGGGFSSFFARQIYQQRAVSTYLQQLGDQYQGFYNPNGRAIPDIAAQALKFPIVLNGYVIFVAGTSASTPVVAGIISLLNDYRISQGLFPLGFLNPWLYSRALSGINDITKGSNPGCNTEGFTAISGWDPVTGLGTLDFERLQKTVNLDLADSGG